MTMTDNRHSLTDTRGVQHLRTGATVMADGRTLEVCEVWLCACSGDHAPNAPTGRCHVKGGEWATTWLDPSTREVVAHEWDEREGARLVAEWDWEPLGGDMYRPPAR